MAANAARLLYELQGIDLELEAKIQAIEDIDSRLEEPEALLVAQEALMAAEASHAGIGRRQRSLERETEDIIARLQTFEERLYGGSVTSAKELTSIQAEVGMLRARRSQREDTMLELMVEEEEVERELGHLRQEVGVRREQWLALRQELLHERSGLDGDVQSHRQARDDMVARVDGASLALYEHLQATRGGRAMATVVQGICQGCHISLPISDIRRARLGREMVPCNSCGRILYVA